jgi:tripartite-type tricarboxylate transporter receptor subunit TctC
LRVWPAALIVCTSAIATAAQTHPSRPIRLVVGLAAGGATDFMARLLAQKMREPLGQSVIVEKRRGA